VFSRLHKNSREEISKLKKDIYLEQIFSSSDYPDSPPTFGASLKLLENGKQLAICHMGFRFDSYSGNCSHRCSYCYARGQNMRYGRWNNVSVANIAKTKKLFENVFDGKKSPLKFNTLEKMIAHRYPIRMGTQTDCFQLAEDKYGISYQFIDEVMNKYDYPYVICTKSDRVANPKYLALFEGRTNVAFQFTLATLKTGYTNLIEPGAPTPSERLRAMNILSTLGYHVSCRMSPYIPEYMDDYVEFITSLSNNKVSHVISELLRVTPILNKVIMRDTNFDVIKYYKSLGASAASGGYYRYPLFNKNEFQYKLSKIVTKLGMTFATCADEQPSTHNVAMCCGLGANEAFSGCPYANYYSLFTLVSQDKNKEITFDEFINSGWCPDIPKMYEVWSSKCFENILMNVEYNSSCDTYHWTDCNQSLLTTNTKPPDLFGTTQVRYN
jgi:DNA repair photolyase